MPDINDKTQVVKVVIFGEEYSIKGTDDPEYIFGVADYLDKKMHDIASKNKNMPPNRIAVLTALNLAGELFDCRRKSTDNLSDVENRAKIILDMLDQSITLEEAG
jgi:cell division protein ZapA